MAAKRPVPQPVLDGFGTTIHFGQKVAYAHAWHGIVLGQVVGFAMRGRDVYVEIEPKQAIYGDVTAYKSPTVLVRHDNVLTSISIENTKTTT